MFGVYGKGAICFNRDVLSSLSVALKSESTKFSAALKEENIFLEGSVKYGAPYITQVGNFDVEVGMEGSVCLVKQIDQPGLIAGIASIFAEDNVNVSFMTVSRTGKGQEAIMAIGIDDEPSEQVRPTVNIFQCHLHWYECCFYPSNFWRKS